MSFPLSSPPLKYSFLDSYTLSATFPTPLRGASITNATNLTTLPYDTTNPPPFTLKEYDGNPKALGIAIDTQLTRHIFYIGTDRAPHSYAAFVTGLTESGFRAQPDQTQEYWPLADEPSSDFAIASHLGTSAIRLYYLSGGQLVEAKYRGGNWDPASRLEIANTTATAGRNSTTDDKNGGGGGGGLSTGAKAGIGVGAAVGGLLVLAGGVAVWLSRKKKKTGSADAAAATSSDVEGGAAGLAISPAPPMSQASLHDAASATRAGAGSGLSKSDTWDHAELKDSAVTPPPRELESPNLASELPDANDRNELPTAHHVTELP